MPGSVLFLLRSSAIPNCFLTGLSFQRAPLRRGQHKMGESMRGSDICAHGHFLWLDYSDMY